MVPIEVSRELINRVIIQCRTCGYLNVATARPNQIPEALTQLDSTRHKSHDFQVISEFPFIPNPEELAYYDQRVEENHGIYIYPSA